MPFTTAVNPTFNDYVAALRAALTGVGYTETALSGSNEFAYELAASGHNVALKLSPNRVRALPFHGAANSGNSWTAQPNTVVGPGTLTNQVEQDLVAANMTNYWIFSQEVTTGQVAYVHAVVESSPGIFSHLLLGVLRKSGSYSGGAYVSSTWMNAGVPNRNDLVMPFGTSPSTGSNSRSQYVSLIGNTLTGRFASISSGEDYLNCVNGQVVYTWKDTSFGDVDAGLVQDLYTAGTNPSNGLTPLLPLYATLNAESPERFLLLGDVYDARLVNMNNFLGGDTITLGSDTWYLFPVWTKGVNLPFAPHNTFNEPQTDSGFYGLAYKRID